VLLDELRDPSFLNPAVVEDLRSDDVSGSDNGSIVGCSRPSEYDDLGPFFEVKCRLGVVVW
jgi:hypothetical protein